MLMLYLLTSKSCSQGGKCVAVGQRLALSIFFYGCNTRIGWGSVRIPGVLADEAMTYSVT